MRWLRITGLLTLERGDRVTSTDILRQTVGTVPKRINARVGTFVLQAMHRREFAACEVTSLSGRKWKPGEPNDDYRRVCPPLAEASRKGEPLPIRRKVGTVPVLRVETP